MLANEFKLAGERVGRGQDGRAQRIVESANLRQRRSRAEEVREGRGDVRVDRLLLQAFIFEERVKRLERGIDVGDPKHQQLFKRSLTIGQTIGGAAEPLLRGQLAAKDGDVGELCGECKKQL